MTLWYALCAETTLVPSTAARHSSRTTVCMLACTDGESCQATGCAPIAVMRAPASIDRGPAVVPRLELGFVLMWNGRVESCGPVMPREAPQRASVAPCHHEMTSDIDLQGSLILTNKLQALGHQTGRWQIDQQLLELLQDFDERLDAGLRRASAAIEDLSAASSGMDARVKNATARIQLLGQSRFIEQVHPPASPWWPGLLSACHQKLSARTHLGA